MSKYKDISSYRLAIKIRSHKTILVEGVSDKSILSHFLLSKNHQDNQCPDYFIDDVSIVKGDEALSGLGNKSKALTIIGNINNEKLSGMVDREWDNIDLSNLDDSQFVQNGNNVYFTKGHSIENYWFDVDASISFLIRSFPTTIDQAFLKCVEDNFPSILRFAAAFSLTAKDAAVINRATELISYNDISFNAGDFRLSATLDAKLSLRNAAINFAAECNNKFCELQTSNQSMLRWICHGHLGEEAIRSCIASIAFTFGVAQSTVVDIERGKKSEKLSHDSEYVCTQDLHCLDPLDKLLNWVRSTS